MYVVLFYFRKFNKRKYTIGNIVYWTTQPIRRAANIDGSGSGRLLFLTATIGKTRNKEKQKYKVQKM